MDDVQQHFLCYEIVESDLDSFILLHLLYADQSFTLAKVIEVDEITLNILPYIQENFSLDGEWKLAPNLTCTVSKTIIIAKQVT